MTVVGRRAGRVRLAVLGALVSFCLVAGHVALATEAPSANDPSALTLVTSEAHPDGFNWLSPRLVELQFHTDILSFDPKVRVLVPESYAEQKNRDRAYPAVWLLHGGTSTASMWTDDGDAESLTAGLPLIVVMPDGGDSGMYTDWWNYGEGGKPMWETFHIELLLPWIDDHFRTIPDRSQRAISGHSMGGFGSASYAARHPDLFGAMAAFSGDVDHNNRIANTILNAAGLGDGGTDISPPVQPSPPCDSSNPLDPIPSQGETITCTKHTPGSVWGPYDTEQVRWRGDNPWDLAINLANTDVSLYTQTGLNEAGQPADPIEHMIWQENVSLHDRLVALGVPLRWHEVPGTHSLSYAKANLQDWLGHLETYFARRAPSPESFDFTSTRTSYERFGWKVSVERPALEFSALEVASPNRFSIVGSGVAHVTTAPLYTPGATYQLLESTLDGSTVREVVADGEGCLTLTVTLGPGNPFQQYSPQAAAYGGANGVAGRALRHPGEVGNVETYPWAATAAGSTFYRTTVAITPPTGPQPHARPPRPER